VAVCIYQFPLFISDKNKHEVSDQTYNYPHNTIVSTSFNFFVKLEHSNTGNVPKPESSDILKIRKTQGASDVI